MESIQLGAYRMWSLYAGGLYVPVVFRAGWTVHVFYLQLIIFFFLGGGGVTRKFFFAEYQTVIGDYKFFQEFYSIPMDES